jgi:hypothetical protein
MATEVWAGNEITFMDIYKWLCIETSLQKFHRVTELIDSDELLLRQGSLIETGALIETRGSY